MIAVTFALPAESSDFIRLLQPLSPRQDADSIRGQIHGREVAVFHTGVGEKSCRVQIQRFLEQDQFRYLISAGFAGALQGKLEIGNLLLADNFTSPELLHSLHLILPNVIRGKLVTAPHMIDSKAERDRLAVQSGALAVDMETAFIAEACATHQLPMLSLRAISDTPSQLFPAPPGVLFDLERQKTDYARLAFYLMTHPSALMRLNAFRHRIAIARKSLTSALEKLLRVDLL